MQSSGIEGYSTAVGPPTSTQGDLPNTGADVGPMLVVGAFMVAVGIVITSALNGIRQARPTPDSAPAYLRGGVVPSTWDQE